jgi:hypothetical protein
MAWRNLIFRPPESTTKGTDMKASLLTAALSVLLSLGVFAGHHEAGEIKNSAVIGTVFPLTALPIRW